MRREPRPERIHNRPRGRIRGDRQVRPHHRFFIQRPRHGLCRVVISRVREQVGQILDHLGRLDSLDLLTQQPAQQRRHRRLTRALAGLEYASHVIESPQIHVTHDQAPPLPTNSHNPLYARVQLFEVFEVRASVQLTVALTPTSRRQLDPRFRARQGVRFVQRLSWEGRMPVVIAHACTLTYPPSSAHQVRRSCFSQASRSSRRITAS